MSNPRQQWLLKVIAGPHQGAEIGLHVGKTLIGSDDECDVVLHDVLVAPQHLELELSAAGIHAAPLGGRVFVNGKRIRDARQSVPNFAFLSIGGSHLVVGPVAEKWPLLSSADVPELEKEVEAPAPAAEAPEESLAEKPASETTPSLKPIASTGAVTPASPAERGSKLGPILGIVAGLMLMVAWVVIYNDFFASREPSEETEELSPLERAQAVVEELGLRGSVKVEGGNGRLTASGYVDSDSRQRELQAVFRATVPGLRTKIYSLEKIASSARALIEDQHLPLTVSSLSDGKLKVTGKLPSADPWVRMRQTLLSEVPGISGIEDGVEIDAPRSNTPNTVFFPVPTVVLKTGSPAPSPAPTATPAPPPPPTPAPTVVSVPEPRAPAPVVLQPDPVTDFLISQDTIDTPEATITAIRASEDGLGFVRLSTGGVYFNGARLPYGGTVMKIDPDAVTIIEKGETRTLRQGDLAMKAKLLTPTAQP